MKKKIWLKNVKNFLSPEPKYRGKTKKIFFADFQFSICFMQFWTKKMKKKILTQNFEILTPHQIARIQNFKIPTSRDDNIYLEDSILKKSAFR